MSAGAFDVLALGAVSPLGMDARQSALLLRANKLEPRPTPWTAPSGRRLACARSRAWPDDVRGAARRAALAAAALEECLLGVPQTRAAPAPLIVAWPSGPSDVEGSAREGADALDALAAAGRGAIDARRSAIAFGGRLAFARALEDAMGRLDRDAAELVVVGAVDSHFDEPRLAAMDAELRLLGETVGDGVIASEGAAFFALRRRGGSGAWARLGHVVAGRDAEATPEDAGAGTGLTDVLRAAIASAGVPTWWLTDVRTERPSRKEHDFAFHRTRRELAGAAVLDVVDDLGDAGAALGALLLAHALMGLQLGFAHGDRALVTLTDDGPERAAIPVEAAR